MIGGPSTFRAEPGVPADGAGLTAIQVLKSLQPAPLLSVGDYEADSFGGRRESHEKAKDAACWSAHRTRALCGPDRFPEPSLVHSRRPPRHHLRRAGCRSRV